MELLVRRRNIWIWIWAHLTFLAVAGVISIGAAAAENDPKCTPALDGTSCQFSRCARGKGLYRCAFGFASGVTGGAAGLSYVVTTPNDSPQKPQPGSLRYGVTTLGGKGKGKGGVWISFSQSMKIVLKEKLYVQSSTTIDGRGFKVVVAGAQLVLQSVSNVILHNLQMDAPANKSDNTVHVCDASKLIWMDHLTFDDASRMSGIGKLISVNRGSTDVTISNSLLSNTDFNTLLGSSDEDEQDKIMRVTVCRNWFKDSTQRMPHCRWGYCHVLNNLYTNWGYYAIGARARATIHSEANVFEAGQRKEITPWDNSIDNSLDQTAHIDSRRDLLLNGATFHQFLKAAQASSTPAYKSKAPPPLLLANKVSALVRRCAGALHDDSKATACRA